METVLLVAEAISTLILLQEIVLHVLLDVFLASVVPTVSLAKLDIQTMPVLASREIVALLLNFNTEQDA
jgi:hypothetical protein